MPHGDAVAIGQSNLVALFDELSVDGCRVLVLVVAQHRFLASVGECGDVDDAMLSAHISVNCLYLHRSLRGRSLAPNDVPPILKRIDFPSA